MSSRALKRIYKNNLEDELVKYQSPLAKEEAEVLPIQTKSAANAFSMLNDISSEPNSDIEAEIVTPTIKEAKNDGNASKQIKPAKKATKTVNVDDLDDDEFDKLLADMKINDRGHEQEDFSSDSDVYESADDEDPNETIVPCPIYTEGAKLLTPKKFKKCVHLLKLNARDLNPDREYENLFGKLSTAAIDAADSTSSSFVTPEILKEIKKLSKRVRGWSGRDRRSIPGTSRKLSLTKIRDDWIPIQKKPMSLDEIDSIHLLALYSTKYKNDWKDVIEEDISRDLKSGIKYYQMSPGPMYSTAATTEFFLSTCVQPDHESLIRLLQKSPYSLETILQVASILQRQGDNSNTNGLIERALFILDWSFSNSFELGDGYSRLPFEFFLNREVYLTIFRYITVLTQKSTFYTAFTYCKLLLSFDPAEDPYGVRYFIDYYSFMAGEYEWFIEFFNSALCQCYSEWKTPALMYTLAFCYLKLDQKENAIEALEKAYSEHPYTGHKILENLGDSYHPWLLSEVSESVELATSIYIIRLPMILEEQPLQSIVKTELGKIVESIGKPKLSNYYFNNKSTIPYNLLRHVILSNESSAMAKIPESFWRENEVYEFDLLPPKIGTTIYNYIDDERITQGMMQQSLQAEEVRILDNLLDQRVEER